MKKHEKLYLPSFGTALKNGTLVFLSTVIVSGAVAGIEIGMTYLFSLFF